MVTGVTLSCKVQQAAVNNLLGFAMITGAKSMPLHASCARLACLHPQPSRCPSAAAPGGTAPSHQGPSPTPSLLHLHGLVPPSLHLHSTAAAAVPGIRPSLHPPTPPAIICMIISPNCLGTVDI